MVLRFYFFPFVFSIPPILSILSLFRIEIQMNSTIARNIGSAIMRFIFYEFLLYFYQKNEELIPSVYCQHHTIKKYVGLYGKQDAFYYMLLSQIQDLW